MEQTLTTPVRKTVHPSRVWGQAVALLALVLVSYAGVWKAGFIWDDDMHITANPVVVGPLGLREIWTTPAARICPLTLSTFWAVHQLFGLNPTVFHGLTLAFFAASILVLWRVLAEMRIRWAWLGAALWAVHPVQVETVAWATELKNTQSGLFFLLCILFYIRFLCASEGRGWLYGAMLICGACAMASKSSTVVLPAILALCYWWQTGTWRWRALKAIVPVILFSLASAALSVWTQGAEGARDLQWDRGMLERIVIAGRVVWFYLGKLIWPDPVMFIYPRWKMAPGAVMSWAPVVALVLLATVLAIWRGRGRAAWMALACFVVMLGPVLGLLEHYFLRYSFVGDHFQYLPSIAPLALLAALIGRLGLRWGSVVGAAVLVCFSAITIRQVPVYETSKALFEDTIAKNPDAWMAYSNLSVIALTEGDHDAAEKYATRCLELLKEHPGALSTMGNVSLRVGKVSEAIDFFTRAVAEYERQGFKGALYHEALSSLSAAHFQKGETDKAIEWGERAVAAAPQFAPGYNNLGVALAAAGKVTDAKARYKQALALDPHYAQAAENLGRTLLETGEQDAALDYFRQAVEMKPQEVHYRQSLAVALCKSGHLDEGLLELDAIIETEAHDEDARLAKAEILALNGRAAEAIQCYEEMLQLNMESLEVLNAMAGLELDVSDWTGAAAHARKALELEPDSGDAHYHLGTALLMSGDLNEALNHLRKAAAELPDAYPVKANLGAALLQSNQLDEAVEVLTKACEINPFAPGAPSSLGRAWLAKGDATEALPWLRKAVELNPKSVQDWVSIAWVLSVHPDASIRNGVDALTAAKNAEQAAGGENAGVLRVVASAYGELGNFAEAQLHARRALELLETGEDPGGLANALRAELRHYEAGEPLSRR